ncbi:MAG: FecR domain-containing protein [Tannerella sp.]|jgi:ferric-dicitrate binding protein FerR (iron transport regulator)|nr:FecR domain-containing protein [Tannerella sp.]
MEDNDLNNMPRPREEMDVRRTFNRRYVQQPDVDAAWRKFSAKHTSTEKTDNKPHGNIRMIWGFIAGVAATVAVMLSLNLWNNGTDSPQNEVTQVFNASNNSDVVLMSGDMTYMLSASGCDSVLLAQGVAATADSLSYRDVLSDKPQMMTLVTPHGKDYHVTLSDGTEMWLNAGSRLIFPERFTGDRRIVELEGEAYFAVSKDAQHPFEVRTRFFTASVLGTAFNLRAYTATDAHVVLVEGKVALQDRNNSTPILIEPGQKAQWNEQGQFVVNQIDVHSYIQWKDGFFYFDDVPLVEVLQELGRWYNVDVIFENSHKMNARLHFVADRNQNLHSALNHLNMLDIVHVMEENNKITVR